MKSDGGAKIRVIIVDDIPETRENLKKLLYFENDIEVAGMASSGQEAVDLAGNLKPDIVLMDINMPGMDGITAGELITHKVPQAQIVMMSVQGEADYLRRSMLAGAREFLIKPFSSEELSSTIRRVYELGASRRAALAEMPIAEQTTTSGPARPVVQGTRAALAPIIAVYAAKGGVGTSTLAVNLAVAMREAAPNAKIILVDASVQFGSVDVLLNLQAARTIVNLVEKISDLDAEIINGIAATHTSGIKVLLAPPRPEMADLVTAEHMETILKALRRQFDYVVVDMSTALHDLELSILDMATRIVLVTTPEIPAIKNTKTFFDVTGALEYPSEKIKLVINQADRRGGIRPEDIEASIRHPVMAALPLDERVASTAINQGVPLTLTHRNSTLAAGILDLARRLMLDLQPAPAVAAPDGAAAAPAKPGNLLGKLFR